MCKYWIYTVMIRIKVWVFDTSFSFISFFLSCGPFSPHKYSLGIIQTLPGASMYDSFAYDVGVLHFFVDETKNGQSGSYRSLSGSSRRYQRTTSGNGSDSGSLRNSLKGSLQRAGSFSRGKSFFTKTKQSSDFPATMDSPNKGTGGLSSSLKENTSGSRGKRTSTFN
jgi:hypothetical protein